MKQVRLEEFPELAPVVSMLERVRERIIARNSVQRNLIYKQSNLDRVVQ